MDEREIQHDIHREERIRAREEREGKHRNWLGTAIFSALLVFVLGIAAAFLFLRSATGAGPVARIASFLLGRNVSFDSSAGAVVNRIQSLNKLETVSYSIDTVVEGKRDNPVLPDMLFGDRILLIAHGQSIAGVDMSKLQPEAVHVSGKSVTVDLPTSEIFFTRLDSSKTRVYERNTGVLVQQDTNLESETRKQAEQQIEKAAINDGILDQARSNARANITTLLSGLGFENVTVR